MSTVVQASATTEYHSTNEAVHREFAGNFRMSIVEKLIEYPYRTLFVKRHRSRCRDEIEDNIARDQRREAFGP